MELTTRLAIIGAIEYGLVAGCLCVWVAIIKRWRRGEPLVPMLPRRDVPWRFADLAFAAFTVCALALIFQQLASLLLGRELSPTAATTDTSVASAMVAVTAAAGLLGAAISIAWLRMTRGATWADLGLARETDSQDVRLGLLAFLAVAPPVYLLQWLVARFFEEEHFIIETLRRYPDATIFLLVSALVTAFSAPLYEEFFARVLLQGWLEGVKTRRWLPPAPAEADTMANAVHGSSDAMARVYVPPARWLAIFTSATLFAIIHPASSRISLFVLACALGYLYQRTHRILPSLVVHALLNGLSMFLLWLAPEAVS